MLRSGYVDGTYLEEKVESCSHCEYEVDRLEVTVSEVGRHLWGEDTVMWTVVITGTPPNTDSRDSPQHRQ